MPATTESEEDDEKCVFGAGAPSAPGLVQKVTYIEPLVPSASLFDSNDLVSAQKDESGDNLTDEQTVRSSSSSTIRSHTSETMTANRSVTEPPSNLTMVKENSESSSSENETKSSLQTKRRPRKKWSSPKRREIQAGRAGKKGKGAKGGRGESQSSQSSQFLHGVSSTDGSDSSRDQSREREPHSHVEAADLMDIITVSKIEIPPHFVPITEDYEATAKNASLPYQLAMGRSHTKHGKKRKSSQYKLRYKSHDDLASSFDEMFRSPRGSPDSQSAPHAVLACNAQTGEQAENIIAKSSHSPCSIDVKSQKSVSFSSHSDLRKANDKGTIKSALKSKAQVAEESESSQPGGKSSLKGSKPSVPEITSPHAHINAEIESAVERDEKMAREVACDSDTSHPLSLSTRGGDTESNTTDVTSPPRPQAAAHHGIHASSPREEFHLSDISELCEDSATRHSEKNKRRGKLKLNSPPALDESQDMMQLSNTSTEPNECSSETMEESVQSGMTSVPSTRDSRYEFAVAESVLEDSARSPGDMESEDTSRSCTQYEPEDTHVDDSVSSPQRSVTFQVRTDSYSDSETKHVSVDPTVPPADNENPPPQSTGDTRDTKQVSAATEESFVPLPHPDEGDLTSSVSPSTLLPISPLAQSVSPGKRRPGTPNKRSCVSPYSQLSFSDTPSKSVSLGDVKFCPSVSVRDETSLSKSASLREMSKSESMKDAMLNIDSPKDTVSKSESVDGAVNKGESADDDKSESGESGLTSPGLCQDSDSGDSDMAQASGSKQTTSPSPRFTAMARARGSRSGKDEEKDGALLESAMFSIPRNLYPRHHSRRHQQQHQEPLFLVSSSRGDYAERVTTRLVKTAPPPHNPKASGAKVAILRNRSSLAPPPSGPVSKPKRGNQWAGGKLPAHEAAVRGKKGSNAARYQQLCESKASRHARKANKGKAPITETYYQDDKLHVKLKTREPSPSLSRRPEPPATAIPDKQDKSQDKPQDKPQDKQPDKQGKSQGEAKAPASRTTSSPPPPPNADASAAATSARTSTDYDVIEKRAIGPVFNTLLLPQKHKKIPFGRSPLPLGVIRHKPKKHPLEREAFPKWTC